jgi:hypothetical protein
MIGHETIRPYQNPVRALLVARSKDRARSSVQAQINGAADGLVTVRQCSIACRIVVSCYRQLKIRAFEDSGLAEGSGRPLGTADFVTGLERLLGRPIARRAQGANPRPASPAYN